MSGLQSYSHMHGAFENIWAELDLKHNTELQSSEVPKSNPPAADGSKSYLETSFKDLHQSLQRRDREQGYVTCGCLIYYR